MVPPGPPGGAIIGRLEPLALLLRAYPFQDVSPAELEGLLPAFERHEYPRNQVVWRPGDPADALWFVLGGGVRGHLTGVDGEEVVTMIHGPGESFGEIGLFLPGETRLATCTAHEAAVLMSLRREPLVRFLTEHPPALRRMLESLSLGSARHSLAMRDLAFDDVRCRVARRLLRLAAGHGEPVGSGTRITLRLTQSQLAGLVAASRENVNRALSGFVASGAIRQEDGHIVVVRADDLRAALGPAEEDAL